MKMVINVNYGGYGVPEEFMNLLGIDEDDCYGEEFRADPRFVEWVEKKRAEYKPDPDDPWAEGEYDLAVVEIPNEATDYEIEENDGYESVIAVVNGKIIHIS
jgi:hypothetical protein